ncbi:fimbria/pilus chaperone family protein [Dyella sp. 20L07]|uniref:fimbria/pilus chaperone family protein n=1 Tax=Dyella sp. 20L07 TaxID=3384240 RepID=UPI003D2C7A25
MKNGAFPFHQAASFRHCLGRAALFVACTLGVSQAMAATFTLESTTVVLEEREGKVAFNIKNDGEQPLLLVSKVENLDDANVAGRILISPPITRIDPGMSQQVNYVLKKGESLDREVMLKASFEGVTPKATDSAMVMPVRQEIGFLIQPAAVPKSDAPWKDLKLSGDGGALVIENPGKHVIRLSRTLTVMPGEQTVNLDHAYLMPGEKQRIAVTQRPVSVGITPMSRYGFVQQSVTLPVTK